MRCPKCLAENRDKSKFCTDCGAPLGEGADSEGRPCIARERSNDLARVFPVKPFGEAGEIIEESLPVERPSGLR